MARYIVDLPEPDRLKLERIRRLMGWRSHAQTVRELIRVFDENDPGLREFLTKPPP